MNVLITGITGFVGSHLVDYISEFQPGVKIWGTRRYRSKMDNFTREREEKVNWIEGIDLTDINAVEMMLEKSTPDRIFHLAANSYVPESYINPIAVNNNVISQRNIFIALGNIFGHNHSVKIHLACSSEEYGYVKKSELPISEKNPLRPLSPYGVSKVDQDLGGYQEWATYKTDVIRTRGFNHTGARRGDVFVCSNFAKQIAEIEILNKENIIKVGNLAAIRDFTDVRDMVRAYWLALEKGEPGEVYNIGTGRGFYIDEVLDYLMKCQQLI